MVLANSVLAVFVAIGFTYTILPYDNPFILIGVAQSSIENFSPVTMQFNSIDVKDSSKLTSAIDWINRNTEPVAVIVGEKHWRGFMELYLEDERIYRFSDDTKDLAESLRSRGYYAYLFEPDTIACKACIIDSTQRTRSII